MTDETEPLEATDEEPRDVELPRTQPVPGEVVLTCLLLLLLLHYYLVVVVAAAVVVAVLLVLLPLPLPLPHTWPSTRRRGGCCATPRRMPASPPTWLGSGSVVRGKGQGQG